MNLRRDFGFLILGFLITGGCASVQAAPASSATPSPALIVISKADEALEIVDPQTLAVVARAPVGPDPHEVTVSQDGARAYVSNYGHGSLNTLAVIDVINQRALPSIDLGALRGPHGLDTRGGKIWFTAEGSKAIGSFDPKTGKIDWVMGTGQDRTHMLLVSADMGRIVTTNVASGTMSVLEKRAAMDGRGGPHGPPPGGQLPPPRMQKHAPIPDQPFGNWEQTLIEVGRGTEGFDISPDGKEAWGADAEDGDVVVVDLVNKRVAQRIAAGLESANRLKFTPDGKRVFVSMLGQPDVVVFNAATRAEEKRIPVGHGASGMLMQPDGARVYVACTPDDNVAVIDLHSLELIGRVKDVGEPDGLAWAAHERL